MKNMLYSPNITFGRKISLFACAFVLCLVFGSVASTIIAHFCGNSAPVILTSLTIQNIFVFIMPVAITVFFISGKPYSFLNLRTAPSCISIASVILIYAVSTPAMNLVIDWNAHITLPASMKPVEDWLRATEANAQAVTDMLLGSSNIFFCIIVVGLLTGFSEELFFRGMLQKLFFSRPMNIHIAVWGAAFVFSALHFQFFGFIPRMLLGAFFGYMVYWSGSLWTAIIAHALNNSTAIVASAIHSYNGFKLDAIGIPEAHQFPFLALASLIATIAIFIYIRKAVIKAGKPYSVFAPHILD